MPVSKKRNTKKNLGPTKSKKISSQMSDVSGPSPKWFVVHSATILTIPQNCSLKELSEILEEQKIVKSGSSFLLTTQYIISYNLKSGKYKIPKTTHRVGFSNYYIHMPSIYICRETSVVSSKPC